MPFISEYFTVQSHNLPAPYCWLLLRSVGAGVSSKRNHRNFHIRYIISGTAKYIFEDGEIEIREGQGIIMPPKIPYTVYTEKGYQKLDLVPVRKAPETVIMQKTLEVSEGKLTISHPFNLNLSYEKLKHIIIVPSDFNYALIQNKSEGMALAVLEELSRMRRSDFKEKIEKISSLDIKTHNLKILCELTGYSQAHFERLMVQNFGCSGIEYFNRIRTNKICNLLRTTALSIPEIAEITGFYDSSHLTTFFKRRMGITPGRYRKDRLE